ncbi:HxlR family transcriptional regulator [Anseongella ginsenosidimutans]|uniref:HxlR family transcriptional regulator n=1 Tax=Anseongella ginsenosidimutans TaxID=496056 RepID=A0A4R3KPY3_9SPHI|nr:helix-turn-helix domain-containing protein [Anseongella ginsenosidimutans]QEC52244.1 helix-turn-helix transcriptional regulator [Anseongella ginsenosidimutans]TCS86796.1 HxlR family transcriptional regulator [Anseongella ginsenosidimutans]
MVEEKQNFECPITAMLELIGGKWKPIILYNLTFGTRRFGELAFRISGISRKVLTEQLKELEKDGLISRKQYQEIPPRVEYSLTGLGNSLVPVFKEMAGWSYEHVLGKGSC